MSTSNISASDFSPHLFWDVDLRTLDIEAHKAYVIRRVMEYGLMNDWNLLKERYTIDEIKDAISTARTMDPKVISFIAAITNSSIKSFGCYTNQQSNPNFYGY